MEFTINNKEYISIPMDFNTACEMSKNGADLFEDNGIFVLLRAYFAICAKISVKAAGDLINAHIVAGNDISELTNAFNEAVGESGFFKALEAQANAKKAQLGA